MSGERNTVTEEVEEHQTFRVVTIRHTNDRGEQVRQDVRVELKQGFAVNGAADTPEE